MMNPFKPQKTSCHSILLIIVIGCSLFARQLKSAVIPDPVKHSSRLVRRLIDGIKTAEELGPLKVLTNDRANELITLRQGPGEIKTFDAHMNNIVKDGEDQTEFRDWIQTRPTQNGVEIQDNGQYAERDFIDHLLAWHKSKQGFLLSDQVAELLEKYPFSVGAKSGEIPAHSYLRTTAMTPGEFIERYLPPDGAYRTRFWTAVRGDFQDTISYWASDMFTRYEKFAMDEMNKLSGTTPRYNFIDKFLPDIFGVHLEFSNHLDRTPVLDELRNWLPFKTYMSEYLKWAKEHNIWTPSHIETFFRQGKGEYRLKDPFIKYLYKKAAKVHKLPREQAYFHGDIQWEFSSFLHERNNAKFPKKILYKFQDWKYNIRLRWTAFKNRVFNFRWL